MRSDEINELAAALVAAQGEFESVAKSSTNPFFKSKYAGLPEVVKAASPILVKHGLAVSQFISSGYPTDGNVPLDTLVTYLVHKSGQFMSDTMLLKLTKDDAQGQGSAITYARRYAYMAVLGLVADVDDDGESAVRGTPKYVPKPLTAPQKRMQGIGPAEPDKSMAGPIPTPKTINAERIHSETITRLGGVLQLKGISDKNSVCETCGQKLSECIGHYGHIKLELPTFHIGFFKAIIQILQNVCKVACQDCFFHLPSGLLKALSLQSTCSLVAESCCQRKNGERFFSS